MSQAEARALIERFGMQPHPEGGHFVETYRAPALTGGRAPVTQIYFLLQLGEVSHWHRIDAVEIWHWYGGAPLVLSISEDSKQAQAHLLGNDLAAGQTLNAVVPKDAWQSAESLGAWTLVGCTVAPGFEFSGFEMAPPDWRPSGG
ncbi:MAG: cupin domain-containing protein [Rhodospirillales bacterium]|nr:cupin domain-containing protein [Rhodospirillales bacterium]